MNKNVIHIFGASGSGTTTLGKKISEDLGCRFMDADDYFWLPSDPKYTAKRGIRERIDLITKDIEAVNQAVLSGSLAGWGDILIPFFRLAVRLEVPTDIRIQRLEQREHSAFGARIQPGGDMYPHHLEFIRWAKAYDDGDIHMRSRARHDEWQKLLPCRLLILDGTDSLEHNFEIVRDALTGDNKSM